MTLEEKYKELREVLEGAYARASKGKGAERHSHGNTEPFTNQYICRGGRAFGIGALLYQIGKKSEEVTQLPEFYAKINELYDIMVYAGAAVILLREQMNKAQDELRERIKQDGSILHRKDSKSIRKGK